MAGIVTYVCRELGVKDKSMLIFHEALNKPISLFKHYCIHSSTSKYIYLIDEMLKHIENDTFHLGHQCLQFQHIRQINMT